MISFFLLAHLLGFKNPETHAHTSVHALALADGIQHRDLSSIIKLQSLVAIFLKRSKNYQEMKYSYDPPSYLQ